LTAETNENAVEELADVMEVIYAIANVKNCAPEVIETIRKDKSEKRGGFQKKLFLESVE
jgi:predicted house-cleaning noncanonical NTP pyrophosphatase (MazG superfamily)